jgi:hypothetical protein
LTLEAAPLAVPAKRTRSGYLHPLVDGSLYEEIYGRKIRSVKGWLADGRAAKPAPDMPPLDDPVAMVEWWQRVKKNAVPACLLTARAAAREMSAGQEREAPPGGGENLSGTPSGAANAQRRGALNIDDYQPMSFADAVQRQGRYVAAAMAAYDAARASTETSSGELALLAKERDSALEALRKCQKDFDAAEIERGDRPHINDILTELAPLLAHMATAFVDLLSARVGLPRARARALADEWFAELRASRFGTEAIAPAHEENPAA